MAQTKEQENTSKQQATTQRQYAGFGLRFIAWLIDVVILFVFRMIVGLIFGVAQFATLAAVSDPASQEMASLGLGLVSLLIMLGMVIVYVLYFSIMESSKHQATLGKMALRLKVVDRNGERISFGRAIGRYLSKFVSSLILGIGYLMIIWDDRKQGLHDKIVDTYVLKTK